MLHHTFLSNGMTKKVYFLCQEFGLSQVDASSVTGDPFQNCVKVTEQYPN
jgi:hypothetical protein